MVYTYDIPPFIDGVDLVLRVLSPPSTSLVTGAGFLILPGKEAPLQVSHLKRRSQAC